MVYHKAPHCPNIFYRLARPSDLEVLEQIHCDVLPISYNSEFFHDVVNGCDIVSWVAVDCSRPDSRGDELIGFVTARIFLANESEIGDLLRYDTSRTDQTVVYILTLGVVDSYRNLGIATSLIRKVIKYASSIPTCQAVYLHVVAENHPAISLYKKMLFKCVQRLPNFYCINDQIYDAFVFVYFVNGDPSHYSPLDLVVAVATYVKSVVKSLAKRLWKNLDKKVDVRNARD
ncbi:hypothetical protein HHK36_000764 [Tetracentron sinense]|uniref:N-alpha-acetyltransferase 60 n=1 Tax=Tetracentron sinense TaxID=13715 RepID=A0A834ZS43_TETSI|nr:hypothetical protein HHK36_000764 [Tetracentron sinense]